MGRTVVHGLRRAFSRPPTSEIMMLIRKPDAIQSSEITPERVWRARRDLILGAGVAAAGLGLPGWAGRAGPRMRPWASRPCCPGRQAPERHGQADVAV